MKEDDKSPEEDDDLSLSDDESIREDSENIRRLMKIAQAIKEEGASEPEYHAQDHKDAMRSLLLEYRKQFIEAIEFMKAKNEAVPQNIEEAIKHIESQLGIHWAGGSSSKQSPLPLLPPVTLLDKTYAQTRIQDLPADKKIRIGKTYHLQVDIIQDLKFSSLPINLLTNKQETIDIVVQAEDMVIQPDWLYNIVITPSGKSSPPEFILIPQKAGNKTITVQYYYRSHWLTQIKYQVEVLQ